jgi:type IV pilus assembly protein PilY1
LTNWPTATGDTNSTIDDLWHAAVNGRGTYLGAKNPDTLVSGLSGILNDITARQGTAAGLTFSSSRIGASGESADQVGYDSGSWTGELSSFTIVTDVNGDLTYNPVWSASVKLSNLAAGSGWLDKRKIFTMSDKPVPFLFDKLSGAQKTAVENADVVNYLRGENKAGNPYRARHY